MGYSTDLSQTDTDLQDRLTRTRQSLASTSLHRTTGRDCNKQADDDSIGPGLACANAAARCSGRTDVLEHGLERKPGRHSAPGCGRCCTGSNRAQAPLAGAIYGLVADLLTVPRDIAPLIDLALGDTSQRFVVRR